MYKIKLKIPSDIAKRYNRLLKGGMTGNGYVRTDRSQPWPIALDTHLPLQ